MSTGSEKKCVSTNSAWSRPADRSSGRYPNVVLAMILRFEISFSNGSTAGLVACGAGCNFLSAAVLRVDARVFGLTQGSSG
jgi:hypothetical protein